ncbi:sugar transferase [Lacisediminihabitans profunda]|uniref:Sugar transferase n=1 Tax=Lacisediminihabitans profunda TaxID=2594790 RepID=A0A5C8UKD7_9MICO|nr:sugar transferase [Lacisediminihabitans profunda]TXN28224.1 sugar transferase [Lacisediminihabitans profunda]
MSGSARRTAYSALKRGLDIGSSGIALVLLSPIMIVVGVLVAARLGRPVLFAQQRPGLKGKVFRLYKFRTMKNLDLSRGLVTDEQRLTKFGQGLRSTSLDELPTLVNVFRGEMSIVGPRPLLVQYLDRYTPEQARRHDVRPGITGLAQVSGRNSLTWQEKFDLDTEYVDRRSLILDLRILLRTVQTVLRREDISAEGEATAAEFLGSSPRNTQTE